MDAANTGELTQLLRAAGDGDNAAANRVWSAVYEELHRLARYQLAREGKGCSLNSTSIVHEAYFRLVGHEPVKWESRRHFFGAAARAMRQIRTDDARKRGRLKRGGERRPVALNEEPPAFDDDPTELLTLDDALKTLEQVAPRQAEIVMLRYFAGLSVDETASAMNVSPRTVDSEWRFARAWLHRELGKGDTTRMGNR